MPNLSNVFQKLRAIFLCTFFFSFLRFVLFFCLSDTLLLEYLTSDRCCSTIPAGHVFYALSVIWHFWWFPQMPNMKHSNWQSSLRATLWESLPTFSFTWQFYSKFVPLRWNEISLKIRVSISLKYLVGMGEGDGWSWWKVLYAWRLVVTPFCGMFCVDLQVYRKVLYLRIGSCLACIYRLMYPCGQFGEHKRSINVALGCTSSNYSFLS